MWAAPMSWYSLNSWKNLKILEIRFLLWIMYLRAHICGAARAGKYCLPDVEMFLKSFGISEK